jgi:MFS family permease
MDERMSKLDKNVWILMLAGAFGMCVAPLVVFIGGIVGTTLAPTQGLATLPVAALVIGTAMAVVPVARAMQAYGRKKVFLVNSVFSALGSLACGGAVYAGSFWLFCLGVVCLGASLAVIQQFRFAAMESVSPDHAASAASRVLLGGLVAAFLGPELAHIGKDIFDADFAGSFVLLCASSLAGGALLLLYKPVAPVSSSEDVRGGGRRLSVIVKQPVLWAAVMSAGVGYAVMSYIMTATPVSMHHMDGHSLADTKWVIQSHIVAMFLPSFFSGRLIERYGAPRIMLAGLIAYLICGVIALSGKDLMHYWLGLILLGIGWNFLFVAGTALLPQSYRGEERFKVQGLNDFVVFGFQAIASLSSGVVIFNFGWDNLVWLALPMLLLQLFIMANWQRSEWRA